MRHLFLPFLLLTSAAFAAEPPRLNVLWICADDLAAYPLGCYGDKLARTPNIDALAASGVRFDRAYCNSPVCTASRQSFLTGRYPRSLGVTQLKTALPDGTPTLATMFKAAGYDTAAIGKMHFNSTLKHGFDVRVDAPDHRKELAARKPHALPDGVEVQPKWQPFKDPAAVWLNAKALPSGATDADKAMIVVLQRDLPVEHHPFDGWAEDAGVSVDELLAACQTFVDRNYMRRFAAVLNHRKAGFGANGMAVWQVPEEDLEEIGPKMAAFQAVSHCYKRPTYPDWPYSIFTMVHARSMEACEEAIDAIAEDCGLTDPSRRAILYSTYEFKKIRLMYYTPDYKEWEAKALAGDPLPRWKKS